MIRLAEHPDGKEMLESNRGTIIYSLKDHDVSIRKRALDVLFYMCTTENY